MRDSDSLSRLPEMAFRSVALVLIVLAGSRLAHGEQLFPMGNATDGPETVYREFDLPLLADRPIDRPMIGGNPELIEDAGKPCFLVRTQQAGIKIEEPAFVTPATVLTWSWKKENGTVCIIQVGLRNPETGQHRYLGYGAGAWSEPPSPDPTVESFVSTEIPRQWTAIRRNLHDDIKVILGWETAQILSFYLSPWDGEAGSFRDVTIKGVADGDPTTKKQQADLALYSQVGKGDYLPLRIKNSQEQRVETFEANFEECAPGRNSGSNEWSTFGAEGEMDFNAIGRDMHVRYPVFDLVFRLDDGNKEIKPDELESFRLGLVRDRLPAIWGGWQHEGLMYKVSAMTVPSSRLGNFDLYKLQVQNSTDKPLPSKLTAIVEGPPDMALEQGVVRGLGGGPFLLAESPGEAQLVFRDWGLCDKRAKAYATGGGPGKTEEAVARYRLGLDGVPVVYRAKVEPDKKYTVYLAATPHIGGHLLEKPEEVGDLVYEYQVEGCQPKTLDWIGYIRQQSRPFCVGFEGAQDTDGDGYLEIVSGVAAASRIRHTRLSAIYVFPEGTKVDDPESVYSGAMNDQCIWHIDVGATPEQGPTNQHYDKSDIGFARLKLGYHETIAPGQTRDYWLKIPSIHRRQPVSMGYIAHAFRDVLPGAAAPPLDAEKLQSLENLDPREAERQVVDYWNGFFAKAAQFNLPDPILSDIYLSRLATRAVLDVKISDDVVYNPCSPFFYFDHAYRDQAYVVYALDLAGMHDRAERLLKVYCMDVEEVAKGPIAFDGKPLQLGMLKNGLWYTRPGQYDTQGQNIWALVQHDKLSGNRQWLEETSYPYIKRGAMWIVNSRHKHMEEVGDPDDPRYGLIEPGAMEVLEVGQGMHMYYMNGFAVLGLREAADTALALGRSEDHKLFMSECLDLKRSLHKSFVRTFKRIGLYEGYLWFGVEPQGVGMYGFWAHNCLLWPCRSLDPHDPMLSATWRRMESMSNRWGGGMHSEGRGGFWPYIGVDRAVSHLLRGEPDKALDYFCAFTDTAGGTLSWGEGYSNLMAGGDQPHFWADAQWINLFRQLFVFEDESTLWLTPAIFRRWHEPGNRVAISRLPTHFGDLDLSIEPQPDGKTIDYRIKISPKGDQPERELGRLLLYPRIPGGRAIKRVSVDGKPIGEFTRDTVILPASNRGREIQVRLEGG